MESQTPTMTAPEAELTADEKLQRQNMANPILVTGAAGRRLIEAAPEQGRLSYFNL